MVGYLPRYRVSRRDKDRNLAGTILSACDIVLRLCIGYRCEITAPLVLTSESNIRYRVCSAGSIRVIKWLEETGRSRNST